MKKLIIIAAVGLLLYGVYTRNQDRFEKMFRAATEKTGEAPAASATPAETGATAPVVVATPPAVAPAPEAPAAVATPMPAVKALYLLTRVSTTTNDGLIAANAGTKVKIVDRNEDGTVNISDGVNKFTVATNQLTDIPPASAAARPTMPGQPTAMQTTPAAPRPAAMTANSTPAGMSSQSRAIARMQIKDQQAALARQRVEVIGKINNTDANIEFLRGKYTRRRGSSRTVEAGSGGNSLTALYNEKSNLESQLAAIDQQIAALQAQLNSLQ